MLGLKTASNTSCRTARCRSEHRECSSLKRRKVQLPEEEEGPWEENTATWSEALTSSFA